MKKTIVNLLLILVLLITNISVFAESEVKAESNNYYQQLSKKQELKLFYNCDIDIWSEMDENYIYKLVDNYNFFYETQEKLNIKDLNIIKFYTEFAVETLIKENNAILKELNNISNNYIVINEAKVFSPYLSLKIHLLNNAYENRIRLIEDLVKNENSEMYFEYENSYFYDNQRNGESSYINEKLSKKEFDNLIKVTLEILNNKEIPQDSYKNLNIILSPFSFRNNVGGYMLTHCLDGREESIVISSPLGASYTTAKNIILHELGHVFMRDLVGRELYKNVCNLFHKGLNVWDDYKKLYPDLKYDESAYYYEDPIECMAEDFKQYFLNKEDYELNMLLAELDRTVSIEYNTEFEKFMDKYLPLYKPNTDKATMDIKIYTKEMDNNYRLLTNTSRQNVITFDPYIKLNYNKQNLKFSDMSYILYDENENMILDSKLYGSEAALYISKKGTYELRFYIDSPGWRVWCGDVTIKYLEKIK